MARSQRGLAHTFMCTVMCALVPEGETKDDCERVNCNDDDTTSASSVSDGGGGADLRRSDYDDDYGDFEEDVTPPPATTATTTKMPSTLLSRLRSRRLRGDGDIAPAA